MAEIKNLTTQIEVIGTGDAFDNSVTFYNKKDTDSNIRLGAFADSGNFVLSVISIVGTRTDTVETFVYSDITAPTSTDLTDLVEQINSFIHEDENIIAIEEETGTTYTLVNSDHNKIKELNNAGAIALTLNTGLRADFRCTYVQKGAGQVTISGTATLNNTDGFLVTEGQHTPVGIIPSTTTDNYTLAGRLVP